MIKSTFYNLSEVKRKRVTEAIMDEFASSENDKISINRIIEKARISRGSFYQYFDDKIDLVEVAINTLIAPVLEDLPEVIEKSEGDIFTVYKNIFDKFVRISVDERSARVFRNLIYMSKCSGSLAAVYLESRYKGFEPVHEIPGKVDGGRYRFQSEEDMLRLQQILNAVTKMSIKELYVYDVAPEKVRESFSRKLEIIRLGAEK